MEDSKNALDRSQLDPPKMTPKWNAQCGAHIELATLSFSLPF